MLGEDGQKMSKSKRNYREPHEIFDRYGADALRWYFFANQPPWTSIRYSEQAIKDSIPEFLLRLWNVYSFFVIYANIDGFDPAERLAGRPIAGQLRLDAPANWPRASATGPIGKRSELDRWILSELATVTGGVIERMDAYDNYAACGRITEFVDALSNWYVRRSRDRFWSGDKLDTDKADAYWTLYECLLTTCKLIAPFVPFVAEAMWQNLAVGPLRPTGCWRAFTCATSRSREAAAVDAELSERMAAGARDRFAGPRARMGAKLKVRQPLAKVEVVLADRKHQPWLESIAGLIAEELNVKQVEFMRQADQYITYTVLPDLKRLGPRLGKRLPALQEGAGQADAAALLGGAGSGKGGHARAARRSGHAGRRRIFRSACRPKPGWAAAQGPAAWWCCRPR